MIDTSNLSWRCDICGDVRPDALIGVRAVDIGPVDRPGMVVRNVKFCSDRIECWRGAENWNEAARRAEKSAGAARGNVQRRRGRLYAALRTFAQRFF